ncbi:MAG TPA: hypothetical protein VE219_05300 [Candidatus Sulfotelmatobacter sp.]|nr:hypothetical protein [Candidatus Sulfotelmatobacter sp.]
MREAVPLSLACVRQRHVAQVDVDVFGAHPSKIARVALSRDRSGQASYFVQGTRVTLLEASGVHVDLVLI